MSKKSKHHKPKGPRQPPQGQQQQQQTVEDAPKEEIPTQPVAVENVKPVALPEVKEEPKPIELPETISSEETPTKPKRSRNRGKKNKKTPDEEVAGDTAEETSIKQDQEIEEKNNNTVSVLETPKTEETVKDEVATLEQNQSKKASKKGKAPQAPTSAPECNIETEKVPKIAEVDNATKNIDIVDKTKAEDTASDSKGNKNKKGKNKKNKESKQEIDSDNKVSEDEKTAIVSPAVLETKDEKPTELKEVIKPTEGELKKADDIKPPACEFEKGQHEKKNKKGKKGGPKVDNDDINTGKSDQHHVQNTQGVKEDNKVTNAPEKCPFAARAPCEKKDNTDEEIKADISEDDILPALVSSIEKTLEQLIVCESDIALDKQLKLEEENKKKEDEKKKKEDENKKKEDEDKKVEDQIKKTEESKKKEGKNKKKEIECEKKEDGKIGNKNEKQKEEKEAQAKMHKDIAISECEAESNVTTDKKKEIDTTKIEEKHPKEDKEKCDNKGKDKGKKSKNKEAKKCDLMTSEKTTDENLIALETSTPVSTPVVEVKTENIVTTEITKTDEIITNIPQNQSCVVAGSEPKNEDVKKIITDDIRAQSKSPSRKEKRKKSPKPIKPKCPVEENITITGASTAVSFDEVTKPKEVQVPVASPIEAAEIIKTNVSEVITNPFTASSISDDIIDALMRDVPPPFIDETKDATSENPQVEQLIPLTKSETVIEDIPIHEFKNAKTSEETQITAPTLASDKGDIDVSEIKQISDLLDDIKSSQTTQLHDSLINVCQIESNIEKEMKKALEVALGVIMSTPQTETKDDTPQITEIQQEPSKDVKTTVDQHADITEESKTSHKKKSKKHDKTKTQETEPIILEIPDDPPKEEIHHSEIREKPEDLIIIELKDVEHKEAKHNESPKAARRSKDKKNKNKGGGSSKNAQSEHQQTSGSQSEHQQSSTTESSQKSGDKTSQESAEDKKDDTKSEKAADQKTEQKDQQELTVDLNTSSDENAKNESQSESNIIVEPAIISTEERLDFSQIPTSSRQENVHQVKHDEKRKSPPKSQPKNLLGRSSTPAESSNKYDYKKEKNKKDSEHMRNSEFANVRMSNLDPRDVPEPQQAQSQTSTNDSFEDDNDDEFVYKYSFRTVFVANACHVCKEQLNDTRVVCRFCHLVAYCNEGHRDNDWTNHQAFCYAVSTFANAKGQTHVYEDAKTLNGQDYRLLRMQAIVSCEKILKRKLCPWEQEALLYPRMCSLPNCREWKTSLLKDCPDCGQISFCATDPNHLSQEHNVWCGPYKLYYKLVAHQLNHGRLEPNMPTKIPPPGYIIPDKSALLFDELCDNAASKSAADPDCPIPCANKFDFFSTY